MRFVIAVHGTRGDVEPCLAVARELSRRGHSIGLAVPPNLIDFTRQVEIGVTLAYGPDSAKQIESDLFRDYYQWRSPLGWFRKARNYLVNGWQEMGATLWSLSEDADLLLTGTTYQEVAVNVAEARRLPMACLHYFPCRPNTYVLPINLPHLVTVWIWGFVEWLYWQLYRSADQQQRRSLGLRTPASRPSRRISASGALELQAYDPILFPQLIHQLGSLRPFVGGLSLNQRTADDQYALDWIAAGPPPIYFGLGSMTSIVCKASKDMVLAACRELGYRVLVGGSSSTTSPVSVSHSDVFFAPQLCHAEILPLCRIIVHHGGSGTTGAVLRAGVPSIILWVSADQPVWARAVDQLGVGAAMRLSKLTPESLKRVLTRVAGHGYAERAHSLREHVIAADQGLQRAADLLEAHAVRRNRSRACAQGA